MANSARSTTKEVEDIARMIRVAFDANKGKSFGLQKSLQLAAQITSSSSWHAVKASSLKSPKEGKAEPSKPSKYILPLPKKISFLTEFEIPFVFEGATYKMEFEYTADLVEALNLIRLGRPEYARRLVDSTLEEYGISMDVDDQIEICIENLDDDCPLQWIDLSLIPFEDGRVGITAVGNTDDFFELLKAKDFISLDDLVEVGMKRVDFNLDIDFARYIDGDVHPIKLAIEGYSDSKEGLVYIHIDRNFLKQAFFAIHKSWGFKTEVYDESNGALVGTCTINVDDEGIITFPCAKPYPPLTLAIGHLRLILTEPLRACHRGLCAPLLGPRSKSTYLLVREGQMAEQSYFYKDVISKVSQEHREYLQSFGARVLIHSFIDEVLLMKFVVDHIGWVIPSSGYKA